MPLLFFILIFMNCVAEFLLNQMMISMDVLNKKHFLYHTLSGALRIIWIFLGAWFAVPMPILLIGLFVLLFLNVLPYPHRRLLMNNFIMVIYLIYTTLLMTVLGCVALFQGDFAFVLENTVVRVSIMTITFMIFNAICILLLHYHPEFLWKENYDKSKVIIYTRFLLVCIIYHILDAVILSLYPANQINYLLLVSGNVLILFLMFNFMNYNYVFARSKDIRREYEESEILIAQQYFEKESLKKMSEIDSLTNAYSRREIASIMMESIQNGHALICVFIDLDGLKRINDTYGHTFGDQALRRFANACDELLQGKGYLARIGGDEFLLVFLDREIVDIENYIKELQLKLLEPESDKERIYFSYGISYKEDSVDSYIASADQKMYECKNRKRCDSA